MVAANDVWVEDTLTISKREIPVRAGVMRQANLKFFPENPRIYSFITADGRTPSQDEIELKLRDMEHVRQLVQSIRANGGLTDPLLVRDGDFVVLEGNSRLAAYRILCQKNPVQWGLVKVKLLPEDIQDDVVFSLLGEYHIIGRKDWQPYEQAGYLYRRSKNHGVNPAEISKEMGISEQKIKHFINVYEFMIKHRDNDVNRWSYYDEYLKSRVIRKVRENHTEMDKVVVRKIKSREIPKAINVRVELGAIARAGKGILRDFLEKENTFERCHERVHERGIDNEWYKRLNKFRRLLVSEEVRHEFYDMEEAHKKKCAYELRKIKEAIDRIYKKSFASYE